jgi:hypothetical protein
MPSENENRACLEHVLKYFDISFTMRQRRGALNVDCPYCAQDEGKHLGIFYDSDKFNFSCLKCKTSGYLFDFLNHLTNISYSDFEELVKSQRPVEEQTALEQITDIISGDGTEVEIKGPRRVRWPPPGTMPINKLWDDLVVSYFLQKRNLSLKECMEHEARIGVMGRWTGRFIFPVHYKDQVVAFQGRDMTYRQEPRYLTEGDVSYFVYNIENLDPTLPGVITEGVLNAWAVRENAVATFSTAMSPDQIRLLSQTKVPYWILCWDIAEDGSDAFWKGRAAVQSLSGVLGPGKVGYVELPPGEDAASLGRERIWQILKQPKFI